MKRIYLTSLAYTAILIITLFVSCAKDIVDVNGSIEGVVKDHDTGALISNCQVSLSPGGKSTVTSTDGVFSFGNLEPETYTVAFKKAGYEDVSRTVSITSGEVSQLSIVMKSKAAFALSESRLDFGDLSSSLPLVLFNNSDESCSFTINNIPKWASFSHTSGTVSAGNSTSITVSVNRDGLDYGTFNQIVSIEYKGKTSGTASLNLEVKKVKLTSPTVSISEAAEDVTQNGFTIGGEIQATGGAEIISYGHCWATTENPTIESKRTDNGTTKDIGSFKSVLTELTPGTTYYVRAYATNQYGTSYSKQIAVSTQDVASNKWDGTTAKSFAKGSGTSADPYVIETGGQLMLMKDYNDKCFELANNIDLDNKNWLPFEFKGKLDGKGCTILNLTVNRTTDNQGLFSKLMSATVTDVTIKNVNIEAPSNSHIGGLAGNADGSTTISNCKILLTEKSQITGNEYVGGMLGDAGSTTVNVSNCSVDYSGTSAEVIKGNTSVGGLLGGGRQVSSCEVFANIRGAKNVGGIIGYHYGNKDEQIKSCSFKGQISGDEFVGGIVGSAFGNVTACKADVSLTASKGYGGGIVGKLASNDGEKVTACYSTGTISTNSKGNSFGGIAGATEYYSSIVFSYSTVSSTASNFDGIIGSASRTPEFSASTYPTNCKGTNQGECKDIVTFLKECYQSDYDKYWNYSKTWTWTGTIGGSNVNVPCPRLSWE